MYIYICMYMYVYYTLILKTGKVQEWLDCPCQVRPGGVKEGSHVRANECTLADNQRAGEVSCEDMLKNA